MPHESESDNTLFTHSGVSLRSPTPGVLIVDTRQQVPTLHEVLLAVEEFLLAQALLVSRGNRLAARRLLGDGTPGSLRCEPAIEVPVPGVLVLDIRKRVPNRRETLRVVERFLYEQQASAAALREPYR